MSLYEIHTMKAPQLPFILHDTHFTAAHVDYQGNWHENIEILCFTGGEGVVTSNEHRLTVHAGDIVVINANCIHTISCKQELHYYCLIVDRSFCLSNHFDTNCICFDLQVRDAQISELFEDLAREWSTSDESYGIQTIRADVLRLMALLCRRYSNPEAQPFSDSHLLCCIKQAIGYIRSESHRDLSLDELSERVGISKFYFAREFRKLTGYTVVSYIHLVRCENAKALLSQTSQSIGEIARTCGFSNQSYFTRTFLSVVGCLPSEYRKKEERSGAE